MSPYIDFRGLSKHFPGVRALSGVSFGIERATCHAIIGENGAGKSTLGKTLSGLYQPEDGSIFINDQEVKFSSPHDAVKEGISMVHQEILFCENMTVAENLCLYDLPRNGIFANKQAAISKAKQWLSAIDVEIDPLQMVGELSISMQQLVQIAGGIGRGAKILIFDEPTSSLSRAETDRLLALIRELTGKGTTCLYVSHRLEEVVAVCDSVTVLRDGKHISTKSVAETSIPQMVSEMIGRPLGNSEVPTPNIGNEALRVERLTVPQKVANVSFTARQGEILGFGGLVGSGRTELMEAIFGLSDFYEGSIFLFGEQVQIKDAMDGIRKGIGLVPEDRKRHGLILLMNARENITLPTLRSMSKLNWVAGQTERSVAQTFFDRLRVKAPTIDSGSEGLSGGNQQKLVIAKWLAAKCRILIFDEPTRGVDVGAKEEIHTLIREFAAAGNAVIVVSSDMPELLDLSDRIVVMREGNVVGEVLREQASSDGLMRLMAGVDN